MRALIVTGTDTGVGKTIVTAALAATAAAAGLRVTMLKPAQTGLEPGAESDTEVVSRLAGVPTRELVRYPDPLAPLAASRTCGRAPLRLETVTVAVHETDADLVLVEGAGGILVPMGASGWTIADLAQKLHAPCVVVTRAGLGTLNHTALTLEALRTRNITVDVVIGAWPARPQLVHHTNLVDLPALSGVLPENVAGLPVPQFRAQAREWFTTEFCDRITGQTPAAGFPAVRLDTPKSA